MVQCVGCVVPIVVVAAFDAGNDWVPCDVFAASHDTFVFGAPSEVHAAEHTFGGHGVFGRAERLVSVLLSIGVRAAESLFALDGIEELVDSFDVVAGNFNASHSG